jgi:starch synthase
MPDRPLNVLFVAAEATPLVKVGGLADVVGALPKALRALGHDVRVLLPAYGALDREAWRMRPLGRPFPVGLGAEPQLGRLLAGELDGVPLLFADHGPSFGERSAVYTDFVADADRFVVFQALVLGALRALEWQPDLVHVHDWHTGMLPRWLSALRAPGFDYPTTMTIHNLGYQGLVAPWSIGFSGRLLPSTPDGLVNLLAEGIMAADAITTVSPTYAREILTPGAGMGLDAVLRSRASDVHGILNGLDTERFDPRRDPDIAAAYGPEDLTGKARCKAALQAEARLAVDPDVPVVAMVSRLVEQKGLDITIEAMPGLLGGRPLQVVVLGTGDPAVETRLQGLAELFPHGFRLWRRFDPALAQRLYAGADLFLMPSRFEPCGLGQMIAMRYGTLPVVRSTGGLVDTVPDLDEDPDGVGVRFDAYDAPALAEGVARAVAAWEDVPRREAAMRRAMRRDLSWAASATRYADLYRDTVDRHQHPTPAG